MKNNIIKTELDTKFSNYLDSLFEFTDLKKVLRAGSWISGGFARKVFHQMNCIESKKSKETIEEYLKNGSDIDIFSRSKEDYINVKRLFTKGEKYSLTRKIMNHHTNDIIQYETAFTNTFSIPFKEYILNNKNKINLEFFDFKPLKFKMKFQFVNKFFFENIESNLNNFDFVNCKYALTLEDNKYFIIYDKDAEHYDRKNVIDLQSCNSPFLASRIIKYIKDKGLKGIENSEKNKLIIRNYLLKVLTNNWDINIKDNMQYFDMTAANLKIDILHDIINLPPEDIVLFLGKIVKTRANNLNCCYGHSVEIIRTDWALDALSNKGN